jgi:hypothetical protein
MSNKTSTVKKEARNAYNEKKLQDLHSRNRGRTCDLTTIVKTFVIKSEKVAEHVNDNLYNSKQHIHSKNQFATLAF